MSEDKTLATEGNEGTDDTSSQDTQAKTYTQEEFDNHMAGLKRSLTSKFQKQFDELGDLDELKQLKANAEQKKIDDATKRGEFEKVLSELATKKDDEIAKRDAVIKDYKINTPLLSAAAANGAVNAEQVKQLLANQVRLNSETGNVEVVGTDGAVRYNDAGKALEVNDLVNEFLTSNPHFKVAAPATTTTKTNIADKAVKEIDVSKLDMSNPEHKALYKEYRKAKGLS